MPKSKKKTKSKLKQFFFPDNFAAELAKGAQVGQMRRDKFVKYIPTYWLGKGVGIIWRKLRGKSVRQKIVEPTELLKRPLASTRKGLKSPPRVIPPEKKED